MIAFALRRQLPGDAAFCEISAGGRLSWTEKDSTNTDYTNPDGLARKNFKILANISCQAPNLWYCDPEMKYHSAKSVAKMAGVSRATVARWKDTGALIPEEVNGLRLYRESVVARFVAKFRKAKRSTR